MRILIAIVLCLASVSSAAELKLWYAQPAPLEKDWKYPPKPEQQTEGWVEALPVGSGRLGAMVFGGTAEERIQFNEDTLWTGKPHNYVRAGAREHLDTIRKAWELGQAAAEKASLTKRRNELAVKLAYLDDLDATPSLDECGV